MKIKKLSEYGALEGLTIMGKLSKAVSPFAKNKKFMDRLRACFSHADKDDMKQSGAVIFVDIMDLITNDAPELLIEIVSIMSGEDKKKAADFNFLEVADALMELKEDEQLASFLFKHFSLGVKKQQSTSTITEDSV